MSGDSLSLLIYSVILYLYDLGLIFIVGKVVSKIYIDSFIDNNFSKKVSTKNTITLVKKSRIMAIFKKRYKIYNEITSLSLSHNIINDYA